MSNYFTTLGIGYKNHLPRFLEEISYIGYRFAYQVIDIGQLLGLPIKERKVCIIGSRNDINRSLRFPDLSQSKVFNSGCIPPVFNIVTKLSADDEIKSNSNSNNDAIWKQKLSNIEPGKESFIEYEDVCVEILKYVLGDYLTLWKKQQSSNDGLYRFDLCCKIKSGTNQEFFDTIKNYFNTKYIVFEFKNYKDAIGQKEIYTTEKYLYEKALRKVAIIISRKGADDQALKAVKGSLRETGKLIICMSDKDLLDMIDIKKEGEQEPADLLVNLLDELLVHLEK